MANWKLTVDLSALWHAPGSFPERRDAIIKEIKASGWVGFDLAALLSELADTTDEKSFDDVFGYVYDLADEQRIWIET
jgi:hypothetical protein